MEKQNKNPKSCGPPAQLLTEGVKHDTGQDPKVANKNQRRENK